MLYRLLRPLLFRLDPVTAQRVAVGWLRVASMLRRTASAGSLDAGAAVVQAGRATFKAGADLIQVYTGLIYEGPRLVSDLIRQDSAPAKMRKTYQMRGMGRRHAGPVPIRELV
jgi:hypothetical protein